MAKAMLSNMGILPMCLLKERGLEDCATNFSEPLVKNKNNEKKNNETQIYI